MAEDLEEVGAARWKKLVSLNDHKEDRQTETQSRPHVSKKTMSTLLSLQELGTFS